MSIQKSSRLFLAATSVAVLLLGACAPVSKSRPISFIEPVTGMEFVYVEGGSFRMGDLSGNHPEATPVRKVTLPGFHVGIYEVTFEQYDLFCEVTGHSRPDDQEWGRQSNPVINVSWEDARAMADWLSKRTGLPISLPSEAQWEYFSRAGTSTTYWTGKKLPPRFAVCANCGTRWDEKLPAPVGSFPPNSWGIYDTAGNVAEWTLDDKHDNYQGAPTDGSAWLSPGAEDKIYRGGAYSYLAADLAVALRDWTDKGSRLNDLGFRLVINVPAPVIDLQ